MNSDGTAEYVAVLRDIGGNVKIGCDGLAVGNDTGIESALDRVRIELGKKAHVYDVRKKGILDIQIISKR